jgi:rod shape-determining protein MreD
MVLILAVLIHLTVLDRFRICGARPDLVMICVVFFGLFLGRAAGLEAGVVSGLLVDIYALDHFGINMLVLGATGLVAGSLKTSFVKESKRSQALIVFACTAFSMSLHYAVVSAFSGAVSFGMSEYLRSGVLITAIYTSLVSVPVFAQFLKTFRLSEPDELL